MTNPKGLPVIKTSRDGGPPWIAYLDNHDQDGPIGYGNTITHGEAEAVAMLKEILDDKGIEYWEGE